VLVRSEAARRRARPSTLCPLIAPLTRPLARAARAAHMSARVRSRNIFRLSAALCGAAKARRQQCLVMGRGATSNAAALQHVSSRRSPTTPRVVSGRTWRGRRSGERNFILRRSAFGALVRMRRAPPPRMARTQVHGARCARARAARTSSVFIRDGAPPSVSTPAPARARMAAAGAAAARRHPPLLARAASVLGRERSSVARTTAGRRAPTATRLHGRQRPSYRDVAAGRAAGRAGPAAAPRPAPARRACTPVTAAALPRPSACQRGCGRAAAALLRDPGGRAAARTHRGRAGHSCRDGRPAAARRRCRPASCTGGSAAQPARAAAARLCTIT
jgi:hypothetical protein